jgi:hypothetical protein
VGHLAGRNTPLVDWFGIRLDEQPMGELMNTCMLCLEDYPTDETQWQDSPAGYVCEWCLQDATEQAIEDGELIPMCGDCLRPFSDGCNCRDK